MERAARPRKAHQIVGALIERVREPQRERDPVLERERERLTLIEVADAGVVRDVDLPGDLA